MHPFLQSQPPGSGDLSDLLTTAQQTLLDLGVSRVYAVYNFNDIGTHTPYLIIPMPDAESARRAAAYFYTGDPDGPTSLDVDPQQSVAARMFDVAEPIGSTVFCGRRSCLVTVWIARRSRNEMVWLSHSQRSTIPRSDSWSHRVLISVGSSAKCFRCFRSSRAASMVCSLPMV